MTALQDGVILAGMSLCWADIVDATVPVLVVMPAHERGSLLPRAVEIGEARSG